MKKRNTCELLSLVLGVSCLCWVGEFSLFAQQDNSWEDDFQRSSVPGRRTFNSTCAGCHGLDGRGSDRAPNIASGTKIQHLTDAQASSIIANGIPGTGMPAFRTLSEPQVRALVRYLRALRGRYKAGIVPGDAARGKQIFFGKGECSACHTISGEGGFLGPDLSAYGNDLSANAILDAIVRSERIEAAGFRSAVLTTRDGKRLEGVIRNEDNFSVQLQDKDGTFHFFQKSDVQNLEHLGRSLMPTNYRDRLSPAELNGLVSYVMTAGSSLRGPQPTPITKGFSK